MSKRWTIAALVLTLAGLACDVPGAAPAPPTPTLFLLPTLAPTAELPTQAAPASTEFPTLAAATDLPTQAAPSFPTPTSINQSGGGTTRVQIYLIALEDDGKSGEPVGCGDSVVPVEREIPATQAPLRAAMEQLIAIKDQFLGESGLYNSLYNNQFTVGNVTIDANGAAVVELNGEFGLGGICDEPRFEAQLMQTALQFPTVTSARIFINGKLLETLFDPNP